MKIVVKESQIERLVNKYLDSTFSYMNEHYDTDSFGSLRWWEINGKEVIRVEDSLFERNAVGVAYDMWLGFINLFNLLPEDGEEYLKKWLEKNLNLKVHYVYTF